MGYNLTTEHGYNMFDISSMVQKAIRRSDIPHAAFAANELSGKFRNYLWKRLLTVSAEDCYGIMTKEIVALAQADDIINKGKKIGTRNDICIAKAVVLLCMARKNRDADYVACNFMWHDKNLSEEEMEKFIDYRIAEKLQDEYMDIPEYVFDCHTQTGKAKGATRIDFFKAENEALQPRQVSLFDEGSNEMWYKKQMSRGKMGIREQMKALEFMKGKVSDPTYNGEIWPET